MSEPLPESEIEAKVIEAIADQLGVAKSDVTRTSEFDAICDSLDKAELMMEFEDLFEISITDDSATRLKTVADAVEYIHRTLKNTRTRVDRTERP
jgi:acyl carrier protein